MKLEGNSGGSLGGAGRDTGQGSKYIVRMYEILKE